MADDGRQQDPGMSTNSPARPFGRALQVLIGLSLDDFSVLCLHSFLSLVLLRRGISLAVITITLLASLGQFAEQLFCLAFSFHFSLNAIITFPLACILVLLPDLV